MSLFWYEAHAMGVDKRELYELMRSHGFADDAFATLDADARRRLEAFAADLGIEASASEGERAYMASLDEETREEP